jgi:hypothetical protein
MKTNMTDADRFEIFSAWFSRSGHWLYSSKRKAAEKWLKNGIDGLPAAPSAVLVSGFIAASEMR